MIIDSIIVLALLAASQAGATRSTATSGRVTLTATATFSDGATRVIEGHLDRDSDNDGVQDTVVLRVTCDRGAVATAIVSPRDPASGLATGKRVHKPLVVTKDVGNPMASDDWTKRLQGKPAVASWDLATSKGGRESSAASLSEVTLSRADVSPVVC